MVAQRKLRVQGGVAMRLPDWIYGSVVACLTALIGLWKLRLLRSMHGAALAA